MANFRDITKVEEVSKLNKNDKLLVNANGKAKLYNPENFLSEQMTILANLTEIASGLEKTKQDKLPEITSKDAGKFLRVNADGKWEIVTLPAAEGVQF